MDEAELGPADYLPGMRPRQRVRNLAIAVVYVVLSPFIVVGVIMFAVYVLVGIQLGRADVAGIGDRGGGTGTSLHPMIGRLAMLAVTAALAVGIASAFALGFIHLPGTNAPQAAFSFDRTGPSTIEITHQAGDQLDPATLTVRVDGDPVAGSWQPTPVTAGSRYRVTGVEPGSTITVVYTDSESWSATLATHDAGG